MLTDKLDFCFQFAERLYFVNWPAASRHLL